MGKLMGTPPTPPPPDVDTDLSHAEGRGAQDAAGAAREHRSKPGCNQCHGVIDPIGLALENFDAIGRWRDVDLEAKAPIDARTVLPNGRPVDGPAQLRQALFGGRDLFVRAFTEKLMMYARGAGAEGLRHAPGPRRGPPRRGAGLPAVGHRVRHRVERCVPHAGDCRVTRSGTDHVSDETTSVPPDRAARAPASRWRCRCSTR